MRSLLTLFTFIVSSNFLLALPNITAISLNSTTIGQYNKLELTVAVSNTSYTNPYDYTVANGGVLLRGTFTSPSGAVKTIDGFYQQDYAVSNISTGTLSTSGATSWRLRFTPTEVGNWTYSVTFQDGGGTSTASTGSFSCNNSTNKGFVRKQSSKNYFKFDNNTPFIPIGQNVCWYGNGNKLGDYKTWLDNMSTNKSNYFRLWLTYWSIEL